MPMRSALAPAALVLVVSAGPATAAETAAPPAATPTPIASGGLYVRELLPDLGLIGAQVGLHAGLCANPYDTGTGPCAGAFVALPVARWGGGRLSYEIDVRGAFARSDPFTITNPLAYVANLAAGAPPAAAAIGPPGAPFPVRRDVRTDLRLLQISPFGLRYAFVGGPVPRVRPYLAVGVDANVVLSDQKPVRREVSDPLASPIFDAALIGGLVGQAPELAALGLPSGQGSLRVGGHAALGLELRAGERVSLNGEYRFTAIEGAGSGQHAMQAGLGLHW
jgi:hypothetical protein